MTNHQTNQKTNQRTKRTNRLRAAVLGAVLFLTACGTEEAGDVTVIGATSGPYSDQLNEGVQEALEGMRTIRVVEFNDYIQPNRSLVEGSIDANVFQHGLFLANYTDETDESLVGVFSVPTAPIGLYSKRHDALTDVSRGHRIALPNDPVNLARSLRQIASYGWATFDDTVPPEAWTERDVVDNPHDLVFDTLDAATLPRTLDDVDFAFINGNYALASGLTFDEAVALEETPDDYLIQFTVTEEDASSDWVEDVRRAYASRAFYDYTKNETPGYVIPDWLKEAWHDYD